MEEKCSKYTGNLGQTDKFEGSEIIKLLEIIEKNKCHFSKFLKRLDFVLGKRKKLNKIHFLSNKNYVNKYFVLINV